MYSTSESQTACKRCNKGIALTMSNIQTKTTTHTETPPGWPRPKGARKTEVELFLYSEQVVWSLLHGTKVTAMGFYHTSICALVLSYRYKQVVTQNVSRKEASTISDLSNNTESETSRHKTIWTSWRARHDPGRDKQLHNPTDSSTGRSQQILELLSPAAQCTCAHVFDLYNTFVSVNLPSQTVLDEQVTLVMTQCVRSLCNKTDNSTKTSILTGHHCEIQKLDTTVPMKSRQITSNNFRQFLCKACTQGNKQTMQGHARYTTEIAATFLWISLASTVQQKDHSAVDTLRECSFYVPDLKRK